MHAFITKSGSSRLAHYFNLTHPSTKGTSRMANALKWNAIWGKDRSRAFGALYQESHPSNSYQGRTDGKGSNNMTRSYIQRPHHSHARLQEMYAHNESSFENSSPPLSSYHHFPTLPSRKNHTIDNHTHRTDTAPPYSVRPTFPQNSRSSLSYNRCAALHYRLKMHKFTCCKITVE